MNRDEFVLKARMVKEHKKLYNGLFIGIYMFFIPLVLIYEICDLLGRFADILGNFLSTIRGSIIKFAFKKLYGGINNE